MNDVESKITDYITGHLAWGGEGDVRSNGSLLEDGIIDSFGLQQLLTYLEDEFGVVVEDEHLRPDNFNSVAAIGTLVSELRATEQRD